MRHVLVLMVLASFVTFSSSTALMAQARGGARVKGPKVAGAQGPKTTARGPKTTATRGPNTTTARGPKTTATRGPKPAGATKTRATGPSASRPAQSTARGSKPTEPSTTTPNGTTANALPKNPRLVERLRALLPAGTDMTTAASGFRNQGQFVAAVHVSNNLGLPFAELKTRMVDQGFSLGQAIQQLRPGVDADAAARLATRQADDDLVSPGGASRRNPQR